MAERVRLSVFATLDVTDENWERVRRMAYGADDRRPVPSTHEEAKDLADHLDISDVLRLAKTKLTTYETAREVDNLGFTLTDTEMRMIVSTHRMDGVWSHVSARAVGVPFADCYRLVLLGYLERGVSETGNVYRLTQAGRMLAEHIVATLKADLSQHREEVRRHVTKSGIDRLAEARAKEEIDIPEQGSAAAESNRLT